MSTFRLRIQTARLAMLIAAWLAETICPELREPEDRRNDE
jgi:hypothetical protein